MSEHHSIIVIGAGLSGLYTAWELHKRHKDVIVLEAREQIGGRVLSPCIDHTVKGCVDMGAAWVWPELQPRLQALLSKLGVKLFSQNTVGDSLFEAGIDTVHRNTGPSAHSQSCRIEGGGRALIAALQASLPESCIRPEQTVTAIDQTCLSIQTLNGATQAVYSADKIILALPPRLILQSIDFTPSLDDEFVQLWKNIPTWMAGHCKLVFVYDHPFWREQKLSGEVFSQVGPLSEIYDGSPVNETFYALTSFVGLSAVQRQQITVEELKSACLAQLQRLFGEASQNVKTIQIKDWSDDPYTVSHDDLNTMASHPQYPAQALRSFCDNNIILAGTESAQDHGGYLEGALESADHAISLLKIPSA